jgi:cytochrome c-type biogenesis protein CcmF
MIAEIGFGTLILAFILSGYAIAASWVGNKQHKDVWINSGRAAALLMFPVLSLSALFLVILITNGNYEVQYVYLVSSEATPFYLKLAALWGGQSGSLLFWTWMLSFFGFTVMLLKWDRDRDFLPWIVILLAIILAFFVGLIVIFENPFLRFWQMPGGAQVISMFKPGAGVLLSPSNGRGLNPLLRHPGMVFHPPALYLGFTAFVIPYVFGIASLILGRRDDRWIKISRPWTILAWLFLSSGLLLGSRWAYDVLGWGGYWSWDPVENAAFMPWLLGTAFLHGIMVQEKLKLFKRWNMILILLTFSMVVYGTFLTRSGVLSSVHAFAESSIGPAFFAFITLMFVGSLALVFLRWGVLEAEGGLYSVFSRESLFLFNTVILYGLFFVVFLGVNFPLLSELFTGQKMTVGPAWYKQTTGPLFSVLLFLMAVAPLSSWGYSTWKTMLKAVRIPLIFSLLIAGYVYFAGFRAWPAVLGYWLVSLCLLILFFDFINAYFSRRKHHQESVGSTLVHLLRGNRRRYGGILIHISVALMCIGILGIELNQTETQARLKIGESVSLGSYSVQLESVSEFDLEDGRNVARAEIQVFENQKPIATLFPRRDYFYSSQQTVTIPGIFSSLQDDLYVVLVDWEPINSAQATFKVYRNLFINWLWIGGIGLLLGGLVSFSTRLVPKSKKV